MQRIIDSLTNNGGSALDLKVISHYCAETIQSPFSKLVLFNSAIYSADSDRCMFAMKKFLDSDEKMLSSLLSSKAKLKSNKKPWHEKWLAQAGLDSRVECGQSSTKVFVIGDSNFLQASRMNSSGLEQWFYLNDDMPVATLIQEIAEALDDEKTNIIAGGVAFVSLNSYERDIDIWNSVSALFGIQVISVSEQGYSHGGSGVGASKLTGLTEAIVFAKLERFFSLIQVLTHHQIVFESIFNTCPIRPINVSFKELLGPAFEEKFQLNETGYHRLILNYAKTLNNAGLHAACIDLLDIVDRSLWSKFTHKWYVNSLFNLADFERVVEVCEGLTHLSKLSREQLSESRAVLEMKRLLESHHQDPVHPREIMSRKSMVSILHACPPYQSGGYVNRAHGILESLCDLGWEIIGVSRPGFPDSVVERGDFHVYEGVRYLTSGSERKRRDGEYQYMHSTINYYLNVLRDINPSIVHLRSTYVSALPALIAARSLNIPTLYEVSGMWELVYAHKTDPSFVGKYNRTIHLENLVYEYSNKVATSTNFMKEIINSRKSNDSLVEIIPNAVNADMFHPAVKDVSLLNELKWDHNSIVFGYLGSFVDYEGLELLVDAFADLHSLVPNAKLLLVGDGAVMNSVRMKVVQSGLTSSIKLTGRVPHREIPRYYSIVDVTPFPRLDTPATRAVAPLKPFEAMASGKSVVVSDLDALKEIVNYGEYGWIFSAGSKESLTAALRSAYESSFSKRESSISWVRANRTWDNVGRTIESIITNMETNSDA